MGCADGILNCDCYGLGVLEVKYPYYIQIKDPDTASCLQNDNLASNHSCYYQVQCQVLPVVHPMLTCYCNCW